MHMGLSEFSLFLTSTLTSSHREKVQEEENLVNLPFVQTTSKNEVICNLIRVSAHQHTRRTAYLIHFNALGQK